MERPDFQVALDMSNSMHWSTLAALGNAGLSLAQAVMHHEGIIPGSNIHIAMCEVNLAGAKLTKILREQHQLNEELKRKQEEQDIIAKRLQVEEPTVEEVTKEITVRAKPYPGKMWVCDACQQANPEDADICLNPFCSFKVVK